MPALCLLAALAPLASLAQSGGRAYDRHATSLDQALVEIATDLHSLYYVAYNSTNPTADNTFRKLAFRVNRPEAIVRARTGYYAR